MTRVGSTVARLRGALKSFAYSGLRRDRWQHPDRVLAASDVTDGERIADLGAGGGYFTYRLARAVGPDGRVYAVDTDADMRARIRDRAHRAGHGNIVTVAARDDDPGLPEPVDLILIVDAFHHLPDDRIGYLAGLAGALRPGGRIAIIEPRPRWYLFGHATAPERIRVTSERAGYTAAGEHDFLPRQSFTVFARPG